MVQLELPPELQAYQDQFFFETIVDGKEKWMNSHSMCQVIKPGSSWEGKGIDLLFTQCDPRFDRGLSQSTHTIQMIAWLPGTAVRIESTLLTVQMSCPKPDLLPQPKI